MTESSDGGMGKLSKNAYVVAHIFYCNQVNDLTVKKVPPFRIWAILPETYCLWQLNNAHHCSLKKSMSLEITLFYGNDCTYL